jgi:hypothetical protein
MTPGDEPGERDSEVDELRWVTPAEARALLSYESERGLLETLEPRP